MSRLAHRRELTVLAPGPFTTVQDQGRPGLAHWGVGRSGAADRVPPPWPTGWSPTPPWSAVLEVTLGGLAVRAGDRAHVALTGAPRRGPTGRPPGGLRRSRGPPGRRGAGLAVSPAVPAHLPGVRGGIAVPPVLGSRSYDVLARLGPPPLRARRRLPVGRSRAPGRSSTRAPASAGLVWSSSPASPARTRTPWPAGGPRAEPGRSSRGRSAADSDRTGLRLDRPRPGPPRRREWPPEGLVRGAVQLPPAGLPSCCSPTTRSPGATPPSARSTTLLRPGRPAPPGRSGPAGPAMTARPPPRGPAAHCACSAGQASSKGGKRCRRGGPGEPARHCQRRRRLGRLG